MHKMTTPSIRSRVSRVATYAAALSAWLLWLSPANAQTEDSTAITAQQYEPGPGANDILGVQSSRLQAHLEWQLGAHLNVADDVLEVRDLSSGDTVDKIIESQTGLDIIGAIGIRDRFEIGLVIPVTPFRTHGETTVGSVPSDLSVAALGDIRLVPKVAIPGLPDSFRVAISLPLILPTGKNTQFYGEGSIGIEPRLLAEYRLGNGTRIAGNIGFRLRNEKQFVNLVLGNELTYGLGAHVPFKVKNLDLAALATIVGSRVSGADGGEERPLELLVGAEIRPTDKVVIGLAGGPGLSAGYGTPDFRIVANARFHSKPEKKPECLYGEEDMDGFEDDDKCADPDNDGDEVGDEDDMCPNEPGVADNPGLAGCPKDPVTADSAGGEPVPALQQEKDPDGDNILGDNDNCPDVPEDVDSFEDLDGCVDEDNDNDGIKDTDDKCPLQAEIVNGTEDGDGCPDEGKTLVKVTDKQIIILEKVYFDTSKASIKQVSFGLLDQVAATLRGNPQITKVLVEGHTDSRGRDSKNLALSKNRSASVRQYLIDKGVAPERLDAEGYGETRPIDTNKTRKGRANNRRVQFAITEVNGKPVPKDQPDGQPQGQPTPTTP